MLLAGTGWGAGGWRGVSERDPVSFCFVKPWLDRKHRENLPTEMAHPLCRPKSRFSHRYAE